MPYIEPEGLPLFNVGKLNSDVEQKILNDENDRRKEKINFMEEMIKQQEDHENQINQKYGQINEYMELDHDMDKTMENGK